MSQTNDLHGWSTFSRIDGIKSFCFNSSSSIAAVRGLFLYILLAVADQISFVNSTIISCYSSFLCLCKSRLQQRVVCNNVTLDFRPFNEWIGWGALRMRCGIFIKMADKAARSVGSGDQPVPMKLFATWEVEKSSPNCIPRWEYCFYFISLVFLHKNLQPIGSYSITFLSVVIFCCRYSDSRWV